MLQRLNYIMSVAGGIGGGIITAILEMLNNVNWIMQISLGAVIGATISWFVVKILNGIENLIKHKKNERNN